MYSKTGFERKISGIQRFGMTNSINKNQRLKINSLNTQHEFLTFKHHLLQSLNQI